MSVLMRTLKHLRSMSIDKAESLIISGLFKSAACQAQSVLEAPDTKSDVRLRAAYVLLQSLYELNRSPLPRPGIPALQFMQLCEAFEVRCVDYSEPMRILPPRRLSDAQPVITAAYAKSSAPLSLAILWCVRPSCQETNMTALHMS